VAVGSDPNVEAFGLTAGLWVTHRNESSSSIRVAGLAS
jgi:hypothetical protein